MISSQLTMALAQARVAHLRRVADARRHPDVYEPPARTEQRVTLRFGASSDARALAHLAELDSAARLEQPVLLAEVDGRLLAALALSDGTVIADPFHPTADLIDLLRARARHLDGAKRAHRAAARTPGLGAFSRAVTKRSARRRRLADAGE